MGQAGHNFGEEMKVGDLIKDFDGDLGVIVGWDGTNPMVYYTETVFKNVPGSYSIESGHVKEIVYESR